MKKDLINKDVSFTDLSEINEAIKKLETELKNEAKSIYLNETNKNILFKSSHFVFSIVNRSISLNRGFLILTDFNNYITAISLIRMQIDNCLRLFAMSLVTDRKKFYEDVLIGKHIRNMKDAESNKMTDRYLVDKLDRLYPKFKLLYKNTSGFIHFSNEHLFVNNKAKEIDAETYKLTTSIGDIDRLEIFEKVDYGFNMFFVGKCLLKLIKGYRLHMGNVIKKY